MSTMVIKQGRYVDSRNGKHYTLVKWNNIFIVFQGDFRVSTEEFNTYFSLVAAK